MTILGFSRLPSPSFPKWQEAIRLKRSCLRLAVSCRACSRSDASRKIAVVWRPNSKQWRLIWALAAAIVLFWPTQGSRCLAIKTVNWLADPGNTLPRQPGEFSLEDGEDPVAVMAHDSQELEYNRVVASSRLARLRIRLRDMPDPFETSTQRQLLLAIGVLGGLLIWRLGERPGKS
jgi:hypothetical protein